MDAYFRWLLRHPLVVLTGTLVLTAVLGFHALGLRVENRMENVLPAACHRADETQLVPEFRMTGEIGEVSRRLEPGSRSTHSITVESAVECLDRVRPKLESRGNVTSARTAFIGWI